MQATTPLPRFVLLYVQNPEASARFYSELLERAPIERSPTFALFALDAGLMLGLWSRATVAPAPPDTAPGGTGELGFPVASTALVDRLFANWQARGLTVLQPPTRMDFGYTFVATDPDGHRLRVFAPEGA